MNKVTRCA